MKLSHLYCRLVLWLPAGFKDRLKNSRLVAGRLQPALVRCVEFFDYLPGRLRYGTRLVAGRLQARQRSWRETAVFLAGRACTRLFSGLRAAGRLAAENLAGRLAPAGLTISQKAWSGPLLSVIVTCYNYGDFLDSVLNCLEVQSCRNFEIILIDDGSSDPGTIARIAALEKENRPGLTIIRQANQGVIAARNHAIARARGRYIFPLDADDTIEKTFIEKTLFFLENSPDFYFVYTWTNSTGAEEFIWPTRDSDPLEALKENRMGYAVFRKTAFDRIGGYNPVMAEGYEDWELCVNLVAHGYCGRVIREPLYNYYVKPGARNYHAIRKHEKLKRLINELHGGSLRARQGLLRRQAEFRYRVENFLVNLGAGQKEPETVCRLFDCYRERGRVRVDDAFLERLRAFAEARPQERVIFLLDRLRPELFRTPLPANLYLYFPPEYHPFREAAPFYDYLERCWRPQWQPLRELEKTESFHG